MMRKLHTLIGLAALMLVTARPVLAQQTIAGERLRVVQDAEIGGDVGHPSYVSQLLNWLITQDGAGDFRYLFTDELHAKSFIADLEQALAGGQIISKSVAVLAANFTNPAAGAVATLTVRDLPSAENMAVFEAGDTIRLRSFSRAAGSLTIADSYGVVTLYVDQPGGVQDWTFTRNAVADAGSMAAGTIIQADAIVLDYGVSGNGFHEVNAIDGLYGVNSPYSQIVTWTTSPIAANLSVRSRIGNLRGITGNANEFGMLAGTYAATNGQYFRASNLGFELHGINLQIWDGATNVIKLDRTVPSFAIGSGAPSGYGTGTGIWMGKDAGVYKFRVGDPAGNRLTWDGTTLSVVGDGAGVTNINGGNIQTDTITATQIAANAITASEINAGAVTATKISVTTLDAISANLGTITAGSISGVTATFGSTVTLNSSGVTITAGTGSANQVKWTDGSGIFSQSDVLSLNASVAVDLLGPSFAQVRLTGTSFASIGINDGVDLGTSGDPWDAIWGGSLDLTGAAIVDGNLFLGGDLDWTPPTTISADQPVVYSVANGILYRKTNGIAGNTICGAGGFNSIDFHQGIAVAHTCN